MLTLTLWMMTAALAAPEDHAPVDGDLPEVVEVPLAEPAPAMEKAKEPLVSPESLAPAEPVVEAPAAEEPAAETPVAEPAADVLAAEAPVQEPAADVVVAEPAAEEPALDVVPPVVEALAQPALAPTSEEAERAPVAAAKPLSAEPAFTPAPPAGKPTPARPDFTPAPFVEETTTAGKPAATRVALVHIDGPTPEQMAYREERRDEREERRDERLERRQQRTVFGPRPRSRFLGAWAGASLGAPGLNGPTTGSFEAGGIVGGSLRLGVELRGVSYGPTGPDVQLLSSGFLLGWTFETRSVVHPTFDAVFGGGIVQDADGDVLGGVGVLALRGGAELNITRSVRVGASLGWRGISTHNDQVRRDLDGIEGLLAVRLGFF